MSLNMSNQLVSVLKPKFISAGLSICQTNDGKITIGAHEGSAHILLEVSVEECTTLSNDLAVFCAGLVKS
jgi:hypothetical protein